MLTRNYTYYVDLDSFVRPFIVQNAPVCRHIDQDIDAPDESEISAPGLSIVPDEDSRTKGEAFWRSFSSGYLDEEVPEEIIAALRGDQSPWKLIRCAPTISACGEGFNMFLALVNPSVYKGRVYGESFRENMEHGLVWIYLEGEAARYSSFSILAPSPDGADPDRYDVETHGYRFVFTEYDKDGIFRRSEVDSTPSKDGLYPINVTEYV